MPARSTDIRDYLPCPCIISKAWKYYKIISGNRKQARLQAIVFYYDKKKLVDFVLTKKLEENIKHEKYYLGEKND